MIDMRNNRFQGTIPNVYKDCGSLEGFILKGNQLEGELPRSLSKCRSLSVIDLGNNHLNGTFPGWSGELSELQVLVLKSNKFHGHIQPSFAVEFPFPKYSSIKGLEVLSLSHNRLVGRIPDGTQFQTFDENSFEGIGKFVRGKESGIYVGSGELDMAVGATWIVMGYFHVVS
ncbi:leucine-rich repeat-containing protein [Tanacetum coccineum]